MNEPLCKNCQDEGVVERLTVEERDCDLCPRCAICDGRAAHHTDAAFMECFIEWTRHGADVLPTERFHKRYSLPCGFPGLWRDATDAEVPAPPSWALPASERNTQLTCSACGRQGTAPNCCPGFGVGV